MRYDNADGCQDASNTSICNLQIDLPRMKAPVYFYYKLENFYQNHRRYVKSRNDEQLAGKVITKYSQLSISLNEEGGGVL